MNWNVWIHFREAFSDNYIFFYFWPIDCHEIKQKSQNSSKNHEHPNKTRFTLSVILTQKW